MISRSALAAPATVAQPSAASAATATTAAAGVAHVRVTWAGDPAGVSELDVPRVR